MNSRLIGRKESPMNHQIISHDFRFSYEFGDLLLALTALVLPLVALTLSLL